MSKEGKESFAAREEMESGNRIDLSTSPTTVETEPGKFSLSIEKTTEVKITLPNVNEEKNSAYTKMMRDKIARLTLNPERQLETIKIVKRLGIDELLKPRIETILAGIEDQLDLKAVVDFREKMMGLDANLDLGSVELESSVETDFSNIVLGVGIKNHHIFKELSVDVVFDPTSDAVGISGTVDLKDYGRLAVQSSTEFDNVEIEYGNGPVAFSTVVKNDGTFDTFASLETQF